MKHVADNVYYVNRMSYCTQCYVPKLVEFNHDPWKPTVIRCTETVTSLLFALGRTEIRMYLIHVSEVKL